MRTGACINLGAFLRNAYLSELQERRELRAFVTAALQRLHQLLTAGA